MDKQCLWMWEFIKFQTTRDWRPPNLKGFQQHSQNKIPPCAVQFSSVAQSSSVAQRVRLLVTPWIAARQASLSITNSRSSLRLTSIKSVMPSSHLILCRPLLLLPPIPPSIRVFSNESTLHMRWAKYWSFSFSIVPSKERNVQTHCQLHTQNWGVLF